MCSKNSDTKERKGIEKPEAEDTPDSFLKLDPEQSAYFQSLLDWEESSRKTYYVFGRGRCAG